MKRLLLASTLVVSVLSAPLQAQNLDLTPVKKWIAQSADLKTFTASFHQLRYLKTVRKPLESTGTITYAAPDSFRWQSGEPAKMIATLKSGGDLTLQNPEKKEAEVITRKQLEEKADGQGLAFIESGFPKSYEEFSKKFEISAISKEGATYNVETKLAEGSSMIIRKMVLSIAEPDYALTGIQFFFRDGSRVESTFTSLKKNPAISKDAFTPDLSGYAVKKGG